MSREHPELAQCILSNTQLKENCARSLPIERALPCLASVRPRERVSGSSTEEHGFLHYIPASRAGAASSEADVVIIVVVGGVVPPAEPAWRRISRSDRRLDQRPWGRGLPRGLGVAHGGLSPRAGSRCLGCGPARWAASGTPDSRGTGRSMDRAGWPCGDRPSRP